MPVRVKVSRALLAFLITIVMAVDAYLSVLVGLYYPPAISIPTATFISVVGGGAVTYLTTEQAALPPQPGTTPS